MMADEQTTGAAGRYALLSDLADTAAKALVAARKQEEADAQRLVDDGMARLRALGKVKPKVGRPKGARAKKTTEGTA